MKPMLVVVVVFSCNDFTSLDAFLMSCFIAQSCL